MAFSRSLRTYPGSRKKKKKKIWGSQKNIPKRNFFSATMRSSEAIPRARENLRRAEEERPQRVNISNVNKDFISKRLNEITEDVLNEVREENREEFSRSDEMFRLSGPVRDLNDTLQSTREKRQLNDLQNIMSNLEGVFEDIKQTKKIVQTGDVAASRYNLKVQRMKNSVEDAGIKINETPKSQLGHDIEAQLNDIDKLLYGGSPSKTSKREEETKRSERKAPKAYNNLLYSIQKLENKLSGMPVENDSEIQNTDGSSTRSISRGRRYASHHPPVITPLRDSREVLHAPHSTSHLLQEDDLRLTKQSGGTVPFYGASSRSTETALLFFQGKVREVRKMIRRNANEVNDLRHVIETETKNVARLQSNLNQLVPLVVELMMRQRKNDKEWCEIGESVREPLNLLNTKSSEEDFLSHDKNRAELEASELPDIATYVETKLQGISSALAQADAILASTDFENDRQLDEEKRLDDNKDDFQISKNLAHALDLDPLIAIPPSPAVSNENDDVKRETKNVTVSAVSSSRGTKDEEAAATTTTVSEMTTKDSILSLVDMILRQVETRHNGLNAKALKSLIKEYFRILDVDQNPLTAYCEALEKHCQVPDGTISRALLRNTLVNTLRVTPNHLIRLASAYHVVCPNGLVVNSQWEDRVRDLEFSWKVLGLAVASKLDDGNGNVSRVALSEFLEQRKRILGPFETRLAVSSSGPLDMSTQFLPVLKRDFFENVSAYVRMAGTYGIDKIPEQTQSLAIHQSTCRELTCRAASPSDIKLGIVAAESLWELAHMYETSCEDGNQFRTIGLVGVLQHLASVEDSHHRLVDAARCLELFFASDQDEVNVMLNSFD